MDPSTLQNLIARGLGAAARHTGELYDAHRPDDWRNPITPETRYLRLPAVFNNQDPTFTRAARYDRPDRYGAFDTAYTRPGDYLVGPGGSFFIAAQEHLLPPLCVLTNAVLDVLRPNTATTSGLTGYSGIQHTDTTPMLQSWPASILATGPGGQPILPADGSPGIWTILLPPGPYRLHTSDIVTDDQSRSFVVATVDRTLLGHRLTVKQAAA